MLIAALALASAIPATAPSAERRWSGLLAAGGQTKMVTLVDEGGRARLEGGGEAVPLAGFRRDSHGIRFALGGAPCAARIVGDGLVGTSPACTIDLTRTEPLTDPRGAFGLWRLPGGQAIAIAATADSPDPVLFDYSTGAVRTLFHRGGGRFVAGDRLASPNPVSATLRRLGADLRLTRGGKPMLARAIPTREVPLSWTNGEARLSGTVILPAGRGPFAAVVLTQLSTDVPRDAYRQWADFFVSRGMAALIYDRRGLGRSTGDAKGAGMIDLAADAAAAALALKAVPGIDPARIGTWGHSQGGWVAPLAASLSRDIAFVIMQSAPGVTAAEQEIYRVGESARAEQLPAGEVADAVAYERALMEWVRTGAGREALIARAKAARNARWASLVELVDDSLPARPRGDRQRFWYFDPAPALARVIVPVLAIYGDRDAFVPVAKSRSVIEDAFRRAGNRDVTVVTLKGAAHGLWAVDRDRFGDIARSNGLHPDYYRTLDRWLDRHRLGAR